MALVTERIAAQNSGLITLDVVYNDTGQLRVDHFALHNGTDHAIIVWVELRTGAEIYRNTFAPGDHVISPPQTISWRKASRSTDWSIGVAG